MTATRNFFLVFSSAFIFPFFFSIYFTIFVFPLPRTIGGFLTFFRLLQNVLILVTSTLCFQLNFQSLYNDFQFFEVN